MKTPESESPDGRDIANELSEFFKKGGFGKLYSPSESFLPNGPALAEHLDMLLRTGKLSKPERNIDNYKEAFFDNIKPGELFGLHRKMQEIQIQKIFHNWKVAAICEASGSFGPKVDLLKELTLDDMASYAWQRVMESRVSLLQIDPATLGYRLAENRVRQWSDREEIVSFAAYPELGF